MTSMRAAVVVALIGALVLGALAATASRGSTEAAVSHIYGRCPERVDERLLFLRPASAIALVRAVKARVPRLYADLTSMGHRAWPGFTIAALISLRATPNYALPHRIGGTQPYFSIAKRACGFKTAFASVLVFLDFPNCQLPCSRSWVYATSTARGWHVWGAA